MRKSAFCLCENKGKDQLLGSADQHLHFRYIAKSLYFLNPKFKPITILCGCTPLFASFSLGAAHLKMVVMMSQYSDVCDISITQPKSHKHIMRFHKSFCHKFYDECIHEKTYIMMSIALYNFSSCMFHFLLSC